ETQVAELARILDELKTERAQAAVDHRRTVTAFADAVAGETFDDSRAGEGAKMRTQSAERLRDAVLKALREIHKLLQPDQRARLAYLFRTGTLNLGDGPVEGRRGSLASWARRRGAPFSFGRSESALALDRLRGTRRRSQRRRAGSTPPTP